MEVQHYSIDIHRLVNDITGFVAKLKTIYFDCKEPIDDNEMILQKLCVKLEIAFRHGLRDKYSFLGVRKDYWNFFSESLPKDEGVRYVNSITQLNTPQGKGRALIRYCLVQKTLADTIQRSLMHRRKTEWFSSDALLLTSATSTMLISKLYDLNEMEFHLSCTGCDLDMSWPAYGRTSIDGYDKKKRRNSGGSIASTTDFTNERQDPLIALNTELSTLKQFITKEFDKEKTIDDGLGGSSTSNDDTQFNVSDATLEVSRLHQLILKWKSFVDSKVYKADMEIERLFKENNRTSLEYNDKLKQLREHNENESKLVLKDTTMQINDLKSELKTSRDGLASAQEMIQSLNLQNDELSSRCNSFQEKISNLTESLELSETSRRELEGCLHELKHETSKDNESKQKCEHLESKLSENQKEKSSLKKRIEECEAKLRIKTLEQEKLQEAFENVNGLVFNSFEDFDSFYKSQLDDKEKGLKMKSLENTNLQLQVSNITAENKKLHDMLEESQESLTSTQSELQLYLSKEAEEHEKLSGMASELDKFRERFRKLEGIVSQNSTLITETVDNEECQGLNSVEQQCHCLVENLAKTRQQLQITEKTLENVSQEKVMTDNKLQAVLLECQSLRKENNMLESERKRLELEGNDKVRLVEQNKLEMEHLLNSANEKNLCSVNELDEIREKLEEERYLKMIHENEFSELTDELKTEKHEKERILMDLESLKEEMTKNTDQLSIKELEVTNLEKELAKANESRDNISSELDNTMTKMDLVVEENHKLVEERKTYQQELNSLQCTMEQQISSLKFQLSSEALKYDEEIKELSKDREEVIVLKGKIREKEESIAELDTTLKEHNENWHVEKRKLANDTKLLKHEVKVLNENMDADKEEIKSMENTLAISKKNCEKAKRRCEEYKKVINELKNQKSEKENILEQTNLELERDIKQLKAKLVSLLSDKSELWKKSNQLEHDMKNRLSDTWVEDKDVLHCPGCNTEFTIFVRKHHCRFCGNVFCHTCSDRYVKTIHSRKPYRCCNSCYVREKELRSDTSLTSSFTDQKKSIQRNLSTSSYGSDYDTDSNTSRTSSLSIKETILPQDIKTNETEVNNGDDDDYEVIEYSEHYFNFNRDNDLKIETEIHVQKENMDECWSKFDIPPGKRCIMNTNVTSGLQFVVEFTTSPQNIFFAVGFKETGKDDTVIVVEKYRVESGKQVVEDLPTMQNSGFLMLIFDNTSSMLAENKLDFLIYTKSENSPKLEES